MGGPQRSADAMASRSTDSWIEVTSRPSSSSLSSAADEVITTGLRVQHDSDNPRRRRPARGIYEMMHLTDGIRSPSAGGSSQDEYEESESESDPVMSSSNEGLSYQQTTSPAATRRINVTARTESEDDDDENKTALGAPTSHCFTPQPNAFSHPPSSTTRSYEPVPGSYFPSASNAATRPRSSSQRHSYPRTMSHTPHNVLSPSYQADHDAALRASLSTLLSCAAAARALPKPPTSADLADGQGKADRSGTARRGVDAPSNRINPSTLRMVPESEIMGERSSSPSRSSPRTQDKGKRKATGSSARTSSKDGRDLKKLRPTVVPGPEVISPTLLTWVVSAGVLVLMSALSFSAGYAAGRETGRWEASTELASSGEVGSCAREVARSGRLRWTSASGVRA